MHLVQRLRFSPLNEISGLYYRSNAYVAFEQEGGERFVLCRDQELSTNTYFNSFYEFFYIKYTRLRQVGYALRLKGDFRVQIYRERFNHEKKIVGEVHLTNQTPDSPAWVPLPLKDKVEQSGRMHLSIRCMSEQGEFLGGELLTEQEPGEVRLGIATCTFKREELITRTIAKITDDPDLKKLSLDLIVVDNGQSLDPASFPDPRVRLIPNINCGGSGGYSRGMLEAVDNSQCTHLVAMDDDVTLDTEIVLRTITFYQYAKEDNCISGGMMDFEQPHVLYEAGARHNVGKDYPGPNPLKIFVNRHQTYMQQTGALNSLLVEWGIDYGGFWFFAMPMSYVREIGLLMPFFLLGDDIEYSLRIRKHFGEKILFLPPISIWHMPFYRSPKARSRYLWIRNLLIVGLVYRKSSCLNTMYCCTFEFIMELFKYRYTGTYLLIRALEDFLEGPNLVLETDVIKQSAQLQAETRQRGFTPEKVDSIPPRDAHKFFIPAKESAWRTLLRWCTLGNHLVPRFLLSNKAAYTDAVGINQWKKFTLKKRSVAYLLDAGYMSETMIVPFLGLKHSWLWGKLMLKTLWRWRKVRKEWEEAYPWVSSADYWRVFFARQGEKE